jgi:SAM-dependent methyltransferase
MARGILGVIGGLAVWLIVVTVAGIIMRQTWSAYASVADLMTFTLPMMVARLTISAVATVAMGLVTATIASRSMLARLMPGVLLLVLFIPEHLMLWEKFPVWYHLTFLFSLVPLTYLGGELATTATSRKETKLSERSVSLADDPFSGRHPTSHERMTGLPWDASYHDGPPPWDIGQPQPAIVRLASEGGFAGAVLDAGCGTGENALHVASLGLSVLGVDVAETALAIARRKAGDRGIEVEFAAADAFQLERLGRRFETVLDCGLFHTFDRDERPGYVASLASVTEHDGTLYVLCFSNDGPDTGPHPISQEELRAAFNASTGWNVAAIEPDRIQTRYHDDGAPAWFATIKRI